MTGTLAPARDHPANLIDTIANLADTENSEAVVTFIHVSELGFSERLLFGSIFPDDIYWYVMAFKFRSHAISLTPTELPVFEECERSKIVQFR
jgi:hypothetical protein